MEPGPLKVNRNRQVKIYQGNTIISRGHLNPNQPDNVDDGIDTWYISLGKLGYRTVMRNPDITRKGTYLIVI